MKSSTDPTPNMLQWARGVQAETPSLESEPLSLVSFPEVAEILQSWQLGELSQVVALIYPAFMRGKINQSDISEQLGQPAAELLGSVQKILQTQQTVTAQPEYELTLENTQKYIFAISGDMRAIMITLALWVSLLRQLEDSSLEPEPQEALARLGRDLFAPLANRIGLGAAKVELEENSFYYLDPEQYRNLQLKVKQYMAGAEDYLGRFEQFLRQKIEQSKIEIVRLESRSKQLHSIHKKLARVSDIDQMYDLMAVRIILTRESDCYQALGIIHDHFEPVMKQLKDYIANPKPNGYQSLHTTVEALEGRLVEIQIRTQDMHEQAEWGMAAHFHYDAQKDTKAYRKRTAAFLPKKQRWIRDVAQMGELVKGQAAPGELKFDLFNDKVFVFSPQGDLFELPTDSTVLDFAFAVHTEVGLRTWGGKINGTLRSLDHQLKNGDTVEILTNKHPQANRDWLDIVQTPKAQNRIRSWLRSQQYEEFLERGQKRLQLVLDELEFDTSQDEIKQLAQALGFDTVQAMTVALGEGRLKPNQLATRLRPTEPAGSSAPDHQQQATVQVSGQNNIAYRMAGCCQPQPPEPILGYVTRGHGVSVHRQDCGQRPKISARTLKCEWVN